VKAFEYAAPASLAEATKLLADAKGTTRLLAGGTDIIVQLRERLRDADVVVDLKRIPELTQLSYSAAGGLKLGAAVPCHTLYENAEIAAAYSALTDSAHIIGGWQIQSRASIGGNLCNSSPAADSIPSLIALNAKAVISGRGSKREVPIAEFCSGPGKNVLAKGELVETIVFPPKAPDCGSAYERFIPRNEMDIAVAGAASWVQLSGDGKTIVQARIALGAVAATPKFAQEASDYLAGKPANEASFAQAGELAKKVASPISDMRGPAEYRVHLVGVLVRRTLETAVKRATAK
jgi:carbon-monoxide dehydrogenase medium subunit